MQLNLRFPLYSPNAHNCLQKRKYYGCLFVYYFPSPSLALAHLRARSTSSDFLLLPLLRFFIAVYFDLIVWMVEQIC